MYFLQKNNAVFFLCESEIRRLKLDHNIKYWSEFLQLDGIFFMELP